MCSDGNSNPSPGPLRNEGRFPRRKQGLTVTSVLLTDWEHDYQERVVASRLPSYGYGEAQAVRREAPPFSVTINNRKRFR